MGLPTPVSLCILFGVATTDANFLNTTGGVADNPLCKRSSIRDPDIDWTWSRNVNPKWYSCMDPQVVNNAKMCAGDPTSIVFQANGNPQCLAATMSECKFNMHAVSRINFDLVVWNCVGTWISPLWLNPDYWYGGASSGEIDLVEMCPDDQIRTNFAAGGYPVIWDNYNGNYAHVHVSMWNKNGDISVKMCDILGEDADECDGEGAAFYPSVYTSDACKDGKDCTFEFVSDIWNGKAGDGGWKYCAKGKYNPESICSFEISSIRVDAVPGTFKGKCAALARDAPSPGPSPPPPPPPAPQGHCNVGDKVQCQDGLYECAGNKCCGDGSICPSASEDFHGCPHPKHNDCLAAQCYTGDRVICPGNLQGIHCAGNQCCPDKSICPSADHGFSGCPHPKKAQCKDHKAYSGVANATKAIII